MGKARKNLRRRNTVPELVTSFIVRYLIKKGDHHSYYCSNRVCVKPAPRDFIESYVGGSDYWSNNIRKEYRLTSPPQIAFCDGFKNLLLELMVYVKAQHTTGVAWNSTKKGLVRAAYFLIHRCIAE